METGAIAGGVARLDTNSGEEHANRRLRYRLADLYGHEIAEFHCDEPLKEEDVVELSGERWKVCSTVGASARITRL